MNSRAYLRWATALTLLAVLLKTPALFGELIMDDKILLLSPNQRGCGENPFDCFQGLVFNLYYRPLLGASLALGVRLHGVVPFWFHLENLLLYALEIALAFALFRRLFNNQRTALLAGTLFALHPLQIGVSAWIGGRTDTLALSALLAAFLAWSRHQETARALSLWLALSLACFTLAIFTKEQSAALALLLPLLPASQEKPHRKPTEALLFLLPITLFFVLARHFQPADAMQWGDWSGAFRLEMVGRTAWQYAKIYLFPSPSLLHTSSVGAWLPARGGVAMLGILSVTLYFMALWRVRKSPSSRWLLLWFGVALAPCLNLLPVPSQPFAAYRAILPLFGFAGFVANSLAPLLEPNASRLPQRLAQIALLFAALGSLSVHSLEVPRWRSEIETLKVSANADPDFLPLVTYYADLLRTRGKLKEALTYYKACAAALYPKATPLAQKIALLDTPQFRTHVHSLSGLSYMPRKVVSHIARGLADCHYRQREYAEAIPNLRLALACNPKDHEAREELATSLAQQGDFSEAEHHFLILLKAQPTALLWTRLGYVYGKGEHWSKAQHALETALNTKPPLTPQEEAWTRSMLDVAKTKNPYPSKTRR